MHWFAFSLISIFALAVAELTQQHLLNLKNPLSPRTSGVLTFLTQSIFAFPIIFLMGLSGQILSPFHLAVVIPIITVAFVASVAMIFYFKSFQVKNISFSTILISLSVVVSTTLGIIVFGEGTNFLKFLGIVLIMLAIVSVNIKNLNIEKNHYFGLIAGIMFGVSYTIDKFIVRSVHPIIYIAWTFALIALFGFLLNPKEVINEIKVRKLNDYRPILISAIGYLIFNFATLTAYTAGGEVGKVDAINNSQIFLIILFEYFILRHTAGVKRKIITALIAVTGVMILGLL